MGISDINTTFLTAEMTFAEKSVSAAKVILTGFVVVFAVLFLLIFIIKIYSTIIQNLQNKKKSNEEKPIETSINTVVTDCNTPVADEFVSEEVVAVISAAVASMYGASSKVKIKSIKRSENKRTAWANAGIYENVRPF